MVRENIFQGQCQKKTCLVTQHQSRHTKQKSTFVNSTSIRVQLPDPASVRIPDTDTQSISLKARCPAGAYQRVCVSCPPWPMGKALPSHLAGVILFDLRFTLRNLWRSHQPEITGALSGTGPGSRPGVRASGVRVQVWGRS